MGNWCRQQLKLDNAHKRRCGRVYKEVITWKHTRCEGPGSDFSPCVQGIGGDVDVAYTTVCTYGAVEQRTGAMLVAFRYLKISSQYWKHYLHKPSITEHFRTSALQPLQLTNELPVREVVGVSPRVWNIRASPCGYEQAQRLLARGSQQRACKFIADDRSQAMAEYRERLIEIGSYSRRERRCEWLDVREERLAMSKSTTRQLDSNKLNPRSQQTLPVAINCSRASGIGKAKQPYERLFVFQAACVPAVSRHRGFRGQSIARSLYVRRLCL